MNHKKNIMQIVDALNEQCNTNVSVHCQNGLYIMQEDGIEHNPFSSDGTQPTKSGTGLYLYLLGLKDAKEL